MTKRLNARPDASLLWGTVVVGGALGFAVSRLGVSSEDGIAALAAILAVGFGYFGRRDISRPHVLLPVIWYAAVAITQLKVLNYETPWAPATTAIVFLGPLAFAATAALFGAGSARRELDLRMHLRRFSEPRLRACGIVLLALGVIGTYAKTRITGGLPLLADEIDAVRSASGIKVSAWITCLTDCFFLAAWVWLFAVAVARTRSWRWCYAALAIVGVAGEAVNASRNTLLTTIAVPLIFLYVTGVTRRLLRRAAVVSTLVAVVLLAVTSGLFYLRTSQHEQGSFETYFYGSVVATTPSALKPLLPVYVAFGTTLETLNRVVKATPLSPSLRTGLFSVPGIPPQISPFRRATFYDLTSQLSQPYYFNVATYEGSVYADGGTAAVILASLLLGAFFGAARRWLMKRGTLAALAAVSYITYLVGFLFYEDLLTFFTVSVVWDLIVLSAVVAFATSGSRDVAERAVRPWSRLQTTGSGR